ncbi:hypothetical protein [Lolliginicoccus levis]|uniref:hypothetical protein n=1 Tax=Lolliginicoccus levis TaxID=2919542 RepID=UPI00241CB6E7|nr:hypothetical protein [Lolliginicoccus levis]
MPATTDARGALAEARIAASGRDWSRAFDLFSIADEAGCLEPPDLVLFAEVAQAAGQLDTTIAVWERIYRLCSAAGDTVGAGGAAARVAMHLLFDAAMMAPVRAWLRKSEQLLDTVPDSAAHAWCAVVRSYERLMSGDVRAARGAADRAVAIGDESDMAAAAIGRVVQSRVMILTGEVDSGLELLDEVGVAVLSGDLDPLATGVVYCELVCVLQGLAQYDLAEQWTAAMERWCAASATGSLHGRCRVHRAEILRLRGEYEQAEAEVLAACQELRPVLRRELGWPLVELGHIRLRLGDLAGAQDAFAEADSVGWDAASGLALVQLARGAVTAASATIQDGLAHPRRVPSKERPPHSALERVPLLEVEVQVEVAKGSSAAARAAADELGMISSTFRGKALAATAAYADAQVRLADRDLAGALARFAEAADSWQDIGAPYEASLAYRGLADTHRAAGNLVPSQRDLDTSRKLYEQRAFESPPSGRGKPSVQASLAREGEYWSVTFEERTIRVKALRGLDYLARLLGEPGREFHVLDLSNSEEIGDAGNTLDDQARTAYRRRLAEIDDDIDEASMTGDPQRQAQAEAEREFLVRELSRAFGIGGRQRRSGSLSERARVRVTRSIRSAIAHMADHHQALGAHLDHAIRTGTYCSYCPDPQLVVEWSIRSLD